MLQRWRVKRTRERLKEKRMRMSLKERWLPRRTDRGKFCEKKMRKS